MSEFKYYSYGKFLGYTKRCHLYNLSMEHLIHRIMHNNGRKFRISKAMDGLSLVWVDRRGRFCAAFSRPDRDGREYCVVYRCSPPLDNLANENLATRLTGMPVAPIKV